MSGRQVKYVVYNKLTEHAHMTTDLIRKCTFNVGAESLMKFKDDKEKNNRKDSKKVQNKDYYSNFVEVTYPDESKSSSMIIPGGWTQIALDEAEEDKEYIRVVDDDGESYFGSFADLLNEYSTSMLANITAALKPKTAVDKRQPIKGGEEWRAALTVSMFTSYDAIEVAKPSTRATQKSIARDKDKMKLGLAKFKRR
ncbi:hypothetical protein LY78DRAFT_683578 [Colletotrichum sublineola]|nr:hypothetical protein LY78DRAFT_683578 [Colletotrichum sublineola]